MIPSHGYLPSVLMLFFHYLSDGSDFGQVFFYMEEEFHSRMPFYHVPDILPCVEVLEHTEIRVYPAYIILYLVGVLHIVGKLVNIP